MSKITPPIKQYWAYLRKTCQWLNQLARTESLSSVWVYADYCSAVVRHRCLIRQYVIGEFWKLSNPERKNRLTYSRMVKLFNKYNNPEYIHFLNNKHEFNAYFSQFVKRGWIHIKDTDENGFVDFLKKYDSVIIKPVGGVEGGGVRKFTLSEHANTDLAKMYDELLREDVLIEEIIHQHPQMVFGNASVNTIRTHTILDAKGKAHVIKAILRAGVGNSVVDNYCQGGSIYEVDLETGMVSTFGQSKSNSKCYIHPGTDIVMLGYRIPNWETVISECEKAAEHLPQIRIVGWDVAVTNDGIELIEGNHNPDYELLEFLGSTGYYKKIKEVIE